MLNSISALGIQRDDVLSSIANLTVEVKPMRIRQMGFSSRLKAHKNILTLETLKFIAEYLVDANPRQAALRSGIPETYAARHGQWLKKHPFVVAATEHELDTRELQQLRKLISEINLRMDSCKEILGLDIDPE